MSTPKTPDNNAVDAARITPADIRAKFESLQGEVVSTTDSARDLATTVATAVGVAVLLGVFALGLRRGRKRTTVVEVRRV